MLINVNAGKKLESGFLGHQDWYPISYLASCKTTSKTRPRQGRSGGRVPRRIG